MKLIRAVAMVVWVLAMLDASAAQAPQPPSRWAQPAEELAGQIADILGPGSAQMTIRNLSTIQASELPAIRKLLEQDLKARGVVGAGTESANTIRVTLSENARERVWVAEVVEGNETRVAMVEFGSAQPEPAKSTSALVLRKQQLFVAPEPVLAVLETATALVALEPEQIVIYGRSADGWNEVHRAVVGASRTFARDLRGALLGSANGTNVEAWLPGVQCSGHVLPAAQSSDWKIQCRPGDDPWAVTQPPLHLTESSYRTTDENVMVMPIRAFYNTSRNYFTGVLAPSSSSDLPPFYSLAIVPRAAGASALLIGGIDGKVQIVENSALRTVAGTRDWGSDFAIVQSGCSAGTQVITSSSGEAETDSLRAFGIPALEAVPESEPLAMAGTVTALSTSPDGKSVFAVVHSGINQYEVDRVTALCN